MALKFTYFNFPARGELSRLIFTFGGVAFEDNRVTKVEFGAMKPKLPLGQVPVLEVGGQTFSQSAAIQRYAAKRAGLYPQDPLVALRADMISETLAELFTEYIIIRYREKDEVVQAEKFKAFGAGSVAKVFGVLENMVAGPFFLGETASYADVHLFDVVHNALKVNLPDLSLAAYPKLLAIVARVESNEHVAKYLATK